MRTIDLNADLGEGGAVDEVLLELVSSANIACGGHAGDGASMRRAIELAMAAGVAVGAHPGYEDREHFGRRALTLPLDAVTDFVVRQVAEFARIAAEMGAEFHHVKAHGSLYNQADRELELAMAVVKGITAVSPGIILYAPPAGALAAAGRAAGLTICAEGFADRRYLENGALMPRAEPGAVISNVGEAVAQALEIVANGTVETLCVHGDGLASVAILRALRKKLEERGHPIGSKTRC
jgi:5-oxoprolinase (ATP-hydrolysing) subunit A